ncbi:Uncharacterized protein FWK35_00000978 [Aphis craccivora]|uniref:Uncharacterized protein n=1 Tax=Aphis craccivora TaxID=307492 RepID=A0A6G0ZDT8_APHCR|nr:Uncharacterized protein FWK35_00000978 [Aphis craccivora]
MREKREFLRKTSFRPNRFFYMVVIQKLITFKFLRNLSKTRKFAIFHNISRRYLKILPVIKNRVFFTVDKIFLNLNFDFTNFIGTLNLIKLYPSIRTTHKEPCIKFSSCMLCFIEVFIIVGEVISQALSILVTWTQMNLLTTGVISLNLLSLILLRMTSRRHDDRVMVSHYSRSSSSVGPYCELLRDPDQIVYQDEHVSSANISQFADDDKCYVQKLRYYIFVCLALFVFRDFSCIHVFKKSIFTGLNVKSMTDEQWALLVTMLQLIFTASNVFMVEIYGRRKLLLISSLGMLFAAMGLEQSGFNEIYQ